MDILVVYQYFGTPAGGWSTRMYEQTRRWVEKGHKVKVITSAYYKSDIKAKGLISKQTIDGIDVWVVNTPDSNKFSFIKRAFNAVTFSFLSSFMILFLKGNVVLASSGPITVAFPALMAKWIRRLPFAFEVRDLWPEGAIELGLLKSAPMQKFARSLEKLIYKNASLVVPCSLGMEEGVKRVNDNVKTLVIPNACDNELFSIEKTQPEQFPEEIGDTKILLYAGSLGFMDDCLSVIKAMPYLKNDKICLVFLGDGAEKSMLETAAKECGNTNIYFLGLLPKTEVVKWFSIATASLVLFKEFQVLSTSSPNKMFDSFAAGVPIIQNTKGWMKNLVDTYACGINVDSSNPKLFAESIRLLCTDESLQNQMAKNAKDLALTQFNRDILANSYLSELEKIKK